MEGFGSNLFTNAPLACKLVMSGRPHPCGDDAPPIKKGSWPIVIYSHGMMISCHNDICRQMASAGCIVVQVIDHEDGTCHGTRDVKGNPVEFKKAAEDKNGTPYEVVQLTTPDEQLPADIKETIRKFRAPQLKQREDEIETIRLFLTSNEEKPRGWHDIMTQADTTKMIISGYSMGAVTVAYIMGGNNYPPYNAAMSKKGFFKTLL